ncbi:beta-lactamase regulating signal transducer with metallopeptidase domain [Sphingobium sp. OAS761]|uniref:M56 family metallopeptidase n=1 Tax=Sphingobium sp. OAS761 TaxID=2817901 RepID=UPI00209FB6FD|nr:M56 family metallopeptidase [Sphingobium sp. OAS761]MCP1472019.1 beta-lactamase regulating signal transducer with metallopeptidase domain [Sphingobium sp. OAS761]
MSVWLAETLIASTLLMAVVMLLRRPVARWLGAGAAYWLWLLPFVRMLLPALPTEVADPSPLHIAVDQSGLPAMLEAAPVAGGAAPPAASLPWMEIGLAIWLVGMLAFLLVQAVGYVRFRRLMLADATALGQEGRIHIVTSPHASGPLAFGIFRPYICLPVDFALRWDVQEQDMAIAHERAHHERGDLAANMVALLLLAVHWCNPVAWIAYRAYRADQETACDARVLSLYGRDQAHAYGRAILKAAGGRQFAAACHLTRLTTLKGRLKMLSSHETSLHRISWAMAAVALVTATGLALTASGSRAAQQMAAITEKVQGADLGRLTDLVAAPAIASVDTADAVPAVPAAPLPPATRASTDPVVPPAPPEPPLPPAPTADMVPPVPPVPPAPQVSVRSGKGRISVTYPDGRVENHRIPTDAEIERMIPVVDVREGCDGDQVTSHRETVDRNGRRHIRVRICQTAIEARARQAERAGRMGARVGLVAARAQIAAVPMPAEARAEALRDIDEEIARIDRGEED